jgi:hypothetical protein
LLGRGLLQPLNRSGGHHEGCAVGEFHDVAAGRFIEARRSGDRRVGALGLSLQGSV